LQRIDALGMNSISCLVHIRDATHGFQPGDNSTIIGCVYNLLQQVSFPVKFLKFAVSGYPGIGKSAVVSELHEALVPPRALTCRLEVMCLGPVSNKAFSGPVFNDPHSRG
jgi:hypothetical protein